MHTACCGQQTELEQRFMDVMVFANLECHWNVLLLGVHIVLVDVEHDDGVR